MVPGWPLRWLLIPRSIRKSPAPDLCGSWNSAERFYPDICWHPRVSPPTFPIWVVSLQTPRFCFHGSWLVLSEQGWVRGEEVWQLGLLLGFGVITGRKVQNKGGASRSQVFQLHRTWFRVSSHLCCRGAVSQAQRHRGSSARC